MEPPSAALLPWSQELEDLLSKWYKDCIERSRSHARRAIRKKQLYRLLSIPSIIVPIAMASLTQLYPVCDSYEAQLINSMGFLLSGSLAGVGGFLNYGNQYAQHAQYEILYYELYTAIEYILAKPAAFRIHAEVALLETRLTYDALNKSSPDL